VARTPRTGTDAKEPVSSTDKEDSSAEILENAEAQAQDTGQHDEAAEAQAIAEVESVEDQTPPVEATPELPEADSATAAPPSQSAEPKSGGGFLPMVLGGVLAAGLGFGTAVYVLPKILTPPAPPKIDMSVLEGEVAKQNERITTLRAQLDAMKSDTTIADLATAQAALSDRLTQEITSAATSLSQRLDQEAAVMETLDARLLELEKRPVADGAASNLALEAFGREMAKFRKEIDANREAALAAQVQIKATAEEAAARIETAQSEAAQLRAETEAAGQKAKARAALSNVQAALESGGAIDVGLADLKSAGVAIPPELAEQALGVPSFATLLEKFPAAAREALSASLKETAGQGKWERIMAFFKSQVGARSLSPRSGDDPDAVLSRAEAALMARDLEMAVSELSKLPQAGQAKMAEWVALAGRRVTATKAIAAIADAMN
jgi:hypothetical protein